MKFVLNALLLILLICKVLPASASDWVEINLSPVTTLGINKSLTLSDVAKFNSSRQIIIDKLSILLIPDVDYRDGVISKAEIREIIKSSLNMKIDRLTIYGDKVFVNDINQVASVDFNQIALDYLTKKLSNQFSDIRLKIASISHHQRVRSGIVEFKPRWIEKIFPENREVVFVDAINREGSVVQSIPVWIDVVIYENVYVATRDIPAFNRLNQNYFYISKQKVTQKPFSLNSLNGAYISNQYIHSGDYLSAQNIFAAPDVLKGDLIKVDSVSKGVVLTVSAIANSNGKTGDIVQAKSLSSNEMFHGTVIGDKYIIVGDQHEKI